MQMLYPLDLMKVCRDHGLAEGPVKQLRHMVEHRSAYLSQGCCDKLYPGSQTVGLTIPLNISEGLDLSAKQSFSRRQ
jgi:hypothetical protein